jgi:hypothetical protein
MQKITQRRHNVKPIGKTTVGTDAQAPRIHVQRRGAGGSPLHPCEARSLGDAEARGSGGVLVQNVQSIGSGVFPLRARPKRGLLDHVVGPQQQRVRDREAERLRRLQIDDELELGGLLDRLVGGLRALEDLDVISTLASCPA